MIILHCWQEGFLVIAYSAVSELNIFFWFEAHSHSKLFYTNFGDSDGQFSALTQKDMIWKFIISCKLFYSFLKLIDYPRWNCLVDLLDYNWLFLDYFAYLSCILTLFWISWKLIVNWILYVMKFDEYKNRVNFVFCSKEIDKIYALFYIFSLSHPQY